MACCPTYNLEALLERTCIEWDECRLQGLTGREDPAMAEAVIRKVAAEIPHYVSVKEVLPHFQKRGKLIGIEDEQELTRLERNSVEQGAKLASVLIHISKQNRLVLQTLLLSLMDSCEEFHGGTSTHNHWTFAGMLLDAVREVSKQPKYVQPDVTEDIFLFHGVEFSNQLACALAESLGMKRDSFKSFGHVCQKWKGTGTNCTFPKLVRALLTTRGLGKFVTGLCPPCRSNPPAVRNWFYRLRRKNLRKLANYVGLQTEMQYIDNKYFNDKRSIPQMFLRCLRIPDCGDQIEGILSAVGKKLKVKPGRRDRSHVGQRQRATGYSLEEFNLIIQSAVISQRPLYESSESDNASDSGESDVERDSAATRQQCLRPVELTSKNTSEDSYVPEVLDAGQQTKIHCPLLEACERKDWQTFKVLLESRDENSEFVEVESKESGKTAFHYACEDAPMEIVELLLDSGADATWTNQRGSSVLNLPRVFRNEDLLRRILAEFTRKKCSVDTAESKGQTPLMLVCYEGDTLYGSAELLLESCASPDGPMQGSSCPLIIACEGGHLRLVKLLVSRGANLNSQDKRGNTALLHACKARHFSIARYLLDKEGVKVNLSDRAGTTPLFEAVSANEISVVEILLNLGAPINARRFISNEIMTGTVEETPLAHACARGYGDIVTLLIDRGANVNYMCSQNVPPMAFAIICRQEHIIEQMMSCSQLDSTIDGLSSPIIFAVKAQNYKCAKKLVDRLGGFDRTLEEASKRRLDKLIEQVKILESLDPHTISAQEMVSKQRQKVMTTSNYNGAVISNADKEATLDRFSHLCVMVIRDYEDTHNVSLEDLASLAQALYPQNPDIASFLLCVSKHMQTSSGLRKDFLFGNPSPLTFLVSQKEILTPESFCQQAVKYYGDDCVDEFYSKLVASFHTVSLRNTNFTEQFLFNQSTA